MKLRSLAANLALSLGVRLYERPVLDALVGALEDGDPSVRQEAVGAR